VSDEGYEFEYVKEAFTSNWIAPLGPNVTTFEKEFAEALGTYDATALVSGTSAIHLALKLVGVGEGIRPCDPNARDARDDIVLCSSLTFAASVNPIVYQNATPVLIDSEWSTWNLLCSDRLSSGVFSLFDFTLCTCILLLLRALSKVLLNRSRYWPLCYTRIQSLDLPQANGPPEVLLSGSANHMNHVSA
jgi:hypothetical protein